MASYPTTPVVFPTRADATTIFAEHMNAVQEEIAAIEAALILAAGETNADIRLRKTGNALEWGHPAAGRANVLGADVGGTGFIGMSCEAGTTPNTYRTRGVSGLVFKALAGILSIHYVSNPNADNQAGQEYFRADTLGITIPQSWPNRQGHWVDVPYNAANYAASAGAWTVEAADAALNRYTLIGTTMHFAFSINTTTVTATPVWLRIALAKVAARSCSGACVVNNAGALGAAPGMWQTNAGEPFIYIWRDHAHTAYSIATNTTTVQGVATFEVTP
jgi:hypothetical protein